MSKLGAFSLEDMINLTPLKEGGEVQEPKVDEMMSSLRRLQQGNRALEGEIKALISVNDSLQKELDTLHSEAFELDRIQKVKEEECRKLQFQCEESEQDCARQLDQNKQTAEQLEQYKCEIQEFKLKHREQRMRFENLLQQLIEEHKKLKSVFTPGRLPDEINKAKDTESQLLAVEQMKLAQLRSLDEKLEAVKNQKQSATVAAETLE